MQGCRDCKNAIFHEQLGEYKCVIRHTTTKPDKMLRCQFWKHGTPGKSKRDEEEK